ncbi:zinc finger protein [Trichonephila clavipes]|uniref:Zinc finger protein n=1 Tax=Trichonephila clavipes TaxID=2585209 RepID=A0A8X6W3D9_TRICX|nr:zinc finger protein [Trichonephila clavipes]
MELKIQSLLSRGKHTLSKSLPAHGWSAQNLGLSRREEITVSKSPHCAHWRSPQNRLLSSRGKHRPTLAWHSRMRSASDQSALPPRVLEEV